MKAENKKLSSQSISLKSLRTIIITAIFYILALGLFTWLFNQPVS